MNQPSTPNRLPKLLLLAPTIIAAFATSTLALPILGIARAYPLCAVMTFVTAIAYLARGIVMQTKYGKIISLALTILWLIMSAKCVHLRI